MFSTTRDRGETPTLGDNYSRSFNDDGLGDEAGLCAGDGQRRQLANESRLGAGGENAANMAFLRVLLRAKLLQNSEEKCVGVGALKTPYCGVKYVVEAIKILLEKPETILMKEAIEEVTERIGKAGTIHPAKVAHSIH